MTEETKGSSKETSTGMQPNLEALLSYLFGFITGLVFSDRKEKQIRQISRHAIHDCIRCFFCNQFCIACYSYSGVSA